MLRDSDYRISLDLQAASSQYSLPMKQGDKSRKIYITFHENGVPYELSEDAFAVFSAKKPDGNPLFNNCVRVGDHICYEVTEQTTSAVGRLDCEILLYGNGGGLIGSARFNIIVDTRAVGDEEIESSAEYSALTNLIAETDKAIANTNAATDAAEEAANAANKAVDDVNSALAELEEDVSSATSAINSAVSAANTATSNANEAASKATTAASNADTAAQRAETAAENANSAAEEATAATESANNAASAARTAVNEMSILFANAIRGNAKGESTVVDDVSPIEHPLDVTVSNKSKIPFPYADGSVKEHNGITFTVNDDGSITANGTATAAARFWLIANSNPLTIGTGTKITLTGCPAGGSSSTYLIELNTSDYKDGIQDRGSGVTATTKYENYGMQIFIPKGSTVKNLVFKPVLLYTDEMITDFSGVTVTRTGKNLLPYNQLQTNTTNGVTCTNNQEGSFTLSGTAEVEFSFLIYALPVMAGVQYALSGCPAGGGASTYYMRAINAEIGVDAKDYGDGISFTPTANGNVNVRIYTITGYTYNNLVFFPMVEIGETATEYEVYKEPQSAIADANGNVAGLYSTYPTMMLRTEPMGQGVIKYGDVIEKLFFDTNANIDDYLASLTYVESGSYMGTCQLVSGENYNTILIAADLGIMTSGTVTGYVLAVVTGSSGNFTNTTVLYSTSTFDLSSTLTGLKADAIGWKTNSANFAVTVSDVESAFEPINGTVVTDGLRSVTITVEYSRDTQKAIAKMISDAIANLT